MKITIDQLKQLIRRSGPALVAGPALTTNLTRETDCLNMLKDKFPGLDPEGHVSSFLDYGDLILDTGACNSEQLNRLVSEFFANKHFANPQLHGIAKACWSAVVSLAFDDFLRVHLQDWLFEKPWKLTLTTVVESDDIPSLKSVPYYAMLGDIRNRHPEATVATCRSGFLSRERVWGKLLQSFPDRVRSDPIIFLGTKGIPERICDFVNVLFSLSPFKPSHLIFLADDPTALSPTLRNLAAKYTRVDTVECTLTELSTALSRATLQQTLRSGYAPLTQAVIDPAVFSEIEDQVAYVPRKDELRLDPTEHNRLIDALFRPTHLDWSPYALDMEFKRNITESILNSVTGVIGQEQNRKLVLKQARREKAEASAPKSPGFGPEISALGSSPARIRCQLVLAPRFWC